jgi:hypothetical protein
MNRYFEDLRDAFGALQTNCQINGIAIGDAAPLAVMSMLYEAALRDLTANATLEVIGDPRAAKTTPEDFAELARRLAQEAFDANAGSIAQQQKAFSKDARQ